MLHLFDSPLAGAKVVKKHTLLKGCTTEISILSEHKNVFLIPFWSYSVGFNVFLNFPRNQAVYACFSGKHLSRYPGVFCEDY